MRAHMHTHTRTYTCAHAQTHTYTHVHTYTYAHIHTCTHTHSHAPGQSTSRYRSHDLPKVEGTKNCTNRLPDYQEALTKGKFDEFDRSG